MVTVQLLLALTLARALLVGETRHESWPDGAPRAEYEVVVQSDGSETRVGRYRSWHANGVLASEGSFLDDRESGRWKYWDEDGALRAEGSFSRGERVGFWETTHTNGKRASKGRYEKGRRSGEWSFWDETGAKDTRESGVYAYEEHRAADGRLAFAGYRLDGARHGEWSSTWPDLSPQLVGGYARGERHGTWLFHLPGGGLCRRLSGTYEHGRRLAAPAIAAEEIPAPRALAPPEAGALGLVEDAGELRAELEACLALDAQAFDARPPEISFGPEAARWIRGRSRALPLVLEALRACDPESPEGRERIRRIERVALRPMAHGFSFAGTGPESLQSADEARDFVVAWLGLWAALREQAWLFEVELPFSPDGGFLNEPPFLESPESVDPPEVFAARFARRPEGVNTSTLDAALDWLVRQQHADGRWSSSRLPGGVSSDGTSGLDVGATSLSLLALLGAGHGPSRGAYASSVTRGLAWLLAYQDPATDFMHDRFESPEQPGVYLWFSNWIYEHLAATLALSEALALTPSPALRAAAQRALDVVLAARNPYAGWRYAVPANGESDTSVTGWAVVALFTGQQAGLAGDFAPAFAGALDWFTSVSDPATGRVGYQRPGEFSSRTIENRDFPPEKGEALTAEALLCRRLLGQTLKSEAWVARHLQLVGARPPLWDPESKGVDEYYFFLGSQAVALCGGPAQTAWNAGMREVAHAQTGNAELRGSWDPVGAWSRTGGRVCTTALLTLALEAPFRYVLPEGASAPGGARPR